MQLYKKWCLVLGIYLNVYTRSLFQMVNDRDEMSESEVSLSSCLLSSVSAQILSWYKIVTTQLFLHKKNKKYYHTLYFVNN